MMLEFLRTSIYKSSMEGRNRHWKKEASNHEVNDMPENHTKAKNKLNSLLNLLALFFLIGMFGTLFIFWSKIPNPVPVHFNFWGEPDRFSGKGSLFILPVIGIWLFLLLFVFYKYMPNLNELNLQQKEISPEQKKANEKYTRAMLSWHNFLIMLYFFYIHWESIQIALGNKQTLNSYSLPIFLLFLGGSMVYYIVRMRQAK